MTSRFCAAFTSSTNSLTSRETGGKAGSETASTGDSAATAPDCNRRVVRGGAFNYTQRLLRSASRLKANATGRIFNLGFRIARDAD